MNCTAETLLARPRFDNWHVQVGREPLAPKGGLLNGELAAVIGGSPDAARRAAADGIANLREAEGDLR